MSFDARRLRDALGHFACGVAVVACEDEGELHGCTVSSFNSVSLDPPLVLFSLANSAASLAAWRRARHYTVNLLHAGQSELSTRFARPFGEKWRNLQPQRAPMSGAPLLGDAHTWFECASFAHYPGGDHTIFVGRVLALHTDATAQRQPLVFYRGRYRELAPDYSSISTPT